MDYSYLATISVALLFSLWRKIHRKRERFPPISKARQ
jgi:hypothetical protein